MPETEPQHHTRLPSIVTAPELAAYTGRDVSTICRWAKSGHLPALRKLPGLRGAWLFSRDEVLRHL